MKVKQKKPDTELSPNTKISGRVRGRSGWEVCLTRGAGTIPIRPRLGIGLVEEKVLGPEKNGESAKKNRGDSEEKQESQIDLHCLEGNLQRDRKKKKIE